jgi:hypothetical protein
MGEAPDRVDPVAAPDNALLQSLVVQDDVVRLCGRPSRLVGVIAVARAPEPAKFKTATMNFAETEVGYRLSLTRAPMLSSSPAIESAVPVHLHLGGRIAPGASGPMPIRLALPRTTPPGCYGAVFDIGGDRRQVEIEVLADEALDIESRGIVLSGRPGEVVRGRLVFANRGNVPLRLDVLGSIILEDMQPLCVSVQHALEQVRDREVQEDAHRVFLDALVKRVADRRPNTGRVRLADGATTLDPGQAAELAVACRLPSNMIAGSRYQATLECLSARLSIEIVAKAQAADDADIQPEVPKGDAAKAPEGRPQSKPKKKGRPA